MVAICYHVTNGNCNGQLFHCRFYGAEQVKAERIPSPINLEVTQEEAEMLAMFLEEIDSYDKRYNAMIRSMLDTFRSVDVVPPLNMYLQSNGVKISIAFKVVM